MIAALNPPAPAAPAPPPGTATLPLLCHGTQPRLGLAVRPTADGRAEAPFAHLGDGTFDVTPMPEPGLPGPTYRLATAGGPLDVALEARGCPALGMAFPVTGRIGMPARRGTSTFLGRWIWQDG